MHIVIHLPTYKRIQVARIAYSALERTRSEFHELGYTTAVYVGGSCERDRELAEEFDYTFVMLPNQPLGLKFDLLAKYIHRQGPYNWFMEYCSDNVLAVGYAARAHQLMQDPNVSMLGVTDFYCVTLEDTEIRIFEGGHSNVGRLTRWQAVNQTLHKRNELYARRLMRRMDKSFYKSIQRTTGKPAARIEDGVWLLDIKSMLNINPRSAYPKTALSLDRHFPEFIQAHPSWPQAQAKSGATASASTSATASEPSQASTEHGETKPQLKTTTGSSSPALPAAPSAARSKSSTRRRKTTTGKGKSFRAD